MWYIDNYSVEKSIFIQMPFDYTIPNPFLNLTSNLNVSLTNIEKMFRRKLLRLKNLEFSVRNPICLLLVPWRVEGKNLQYRIHTLFRECSCFPKASSYVSFN
jgi:hypothetical protein